MRGGISNKRGQICAEILTVSKEPVTVILSRLQIHESLECYFTFTKAQADFSHTLVIFLLNVNCCAQICLGFFVVVLQKYNLFGCFFGFFSLLCTEFLHLKFFPGYLTPT